MLQPMWTKLEVHTCGGPQQSRQNKKVWALQTLLTEKQN